MPPKQKYSKSNRHPRCKCRTKTAYYNRFKRKKTYRPLKQMGYVYVDTSNCPIHQSERLDDDGKRFYEENGKRIYLE